MTDKTANPALETLKHRARRLHRQSQAGDRTAMARLRKHGMFKALDDGVLPDAIKRRHALAVVAREHGFENWQHVLQVVDGRQTADYGTLLYGRGCGAHTNIWSASYDEARHIRAETTGYLLAYRTQYLVVDEHYIRTLGLDPDDPDWERIGRDWVRPDDKKAHVRLYTKLIEQTADS